jgi:hypothetical protein
VVKFVWLGYIEPGKFENMPKNERDGMLGECFDYDDQLRANGHYAVGEALRPPISAKTVRLKTARSWQLMGPYAETNEQIGEILVLEAGDLDHAVRLVSQHPGLGDTSRRESERDGRGEQAPAGKGRLTR